MRASRILPFARTMRLAIVGAAVRKERAISSVVRPHTSRSVSAIWASGGRAGWQQVKISRSRSSSMLSASHSAGHCAGSLVTPSNWCSSSVIVASNLARLRRESMALNRPAETSQARGFAGTPCCGHCSTAATKASCIASSARSKSPNRRMSDARIRRDSER